MKEKKPIFKNLYVFKDPSGSSLTCGTTFIPANTPLKCFVSERGAYAQIPPLLQGAKTLNGLCHVQSAGSARLAWIILSICSSSMSIPSQPD
jgi:hypothetical protein